jgi:hypothetical protein
VAEITDDGGFNILFRYDFKKDSLLKVKPPKVIYNTLEIFSGLDKAQVDKEINDKVKILKYFTANKITDIDKIAMIVSYYYINKDYLMDKLFGGKN